MATSTVSNDFAQLLEDASIGTIFTDIFPDRRMPDSPDICITINESGGSPTHNEANIERPTIIIAVRHPSPDGLMDLCKQIRNAILKDDSGERRADFTKNNTKYILIQDNSGGWAPFTIEGDDRYYKSRTFSTIKGFEGEN